MKRVGETRLTPAEAAKLRGVPVARIRTWCGSGLLPSYRSVHKWRLIDRNDLIALVRKHPELTAR